MSFLRNMFDHLCCIVRRDCRFDYYNIGLRPRRVQRDRRQLVAHLELDQLLAVQRPSTVRDITVGNCLKRRSDRTPSDAAPRAKLIMHKYNLLDPFLSYLWVKRMSAQ